MKSVRRIKKYDLLLEDFKKLSLENKKLKKGTKNELAILEKRQR